MIRKVITTVVALFLALMLLQFIASESGEVVVLSTKGADGQPVDTRLWVVDLEGYQYLRAGAPESQWLARLSRNGRVGVIRNDLGAAYDAYPEPAKKDAVNDLMRQKYGWADQFVSLMFGRDDATPVRLEIYHEYEGVVAPEIALEPEPE